MLSVDDAARYLLGVSATNDDHGDGFMDDRFEYAADAVGTMARTALAPWGGAGACADAYEAAVRAATDAQLNIARAIGVEPMRSFVASCADLTRDVGATHLSRMRWILDV